MYVFDLIVNMHNITFMIILLSYLFLFSICWCVCLFVLLSKLFSFGSAVCWSLTLSCCASEILLHCLFFSPLVFLSETYVFSLWCFRLWFLYCFIYFDSLLHRQNLLSFLSSACWNLVWNQHKLVCGYLVS